MFSFIYFESILWNKLISLGKKEIHMIIFSKIEGFTKFRVKFDINDYFSQFSMSFWTALSIFKDLRVTPSQKKFINCNILKESNRN